MNTSSAIMVTILVISSASAFGAAFFLLSAWYREADNPRLVKAAGVVYAAVSVLLVMIALAALLLQ